MTSGQTCGGVLIVHYVFDEYEVQILIDDGTGAAFTGAHSPLSGK